MYVESEVSFCVDKERLKCLKYDGFDSFSISGEEFTRDNISSSKLGRYTNLNPGPLIRNLWFSRIQSTTSPIVTMVLGKA